MRRRKASGGTLSAANASNPSSKSPTPVALLAAALPSETGAASKIVSGVTEGVRDALTGLCAARDLPVAAFTRAFDRGCAILGATAVFSARVCVAAPRVETATRCSAACVGTLPAISAGAATSAAPCTADVALDVTAATTAAASGGVAATASANAAGAPIRHAATANGSTHAARIVRSSGDPIPIRFPFGCSFSVCLYPDATTIKTSCWNPGALQRGRGG
jgi:hypothetical protein